MVAGTAGSPSIPGADTQSLSVVIQGPITDLVTTFFVVQSVREFLPGAEIVLSTWKPAASDKSFPARTELLGVDKVILNEDPGAILHNPNGVFSNLTRMLVSTRRGLEEARGHTVLKLRTDTVLTGTGFLDGERGAVLRQKEFAIFDGKVVVPSAFSRRWFPRARVKNSRRYPAILHVSDWAAYGFRSDLVRLYGVRPPVEPHYSTYMSRLWSQLPSDVPFRYLANFQFPPEMYLGLNSIGASLGIEMAHWLDRPDRWVELSDRAMISNFVCLDTARDFGIVNRKYPTVSKRPWQLVDVSDSLWSSRSYQVKYGAIFGTSTSRPIRPSEKLGALHGSLASFYSRVPRRIRQAGSLRRVLLREFC